MQGSTYGTNLAFSTQQLAGWGTRFLAYLIDAIVVAIPAAILQVLHLAFLGSILDIAYFVYFWSTTGVTLGNRVMKIQVVKMDGSPLDWGTGIVRYIGAILNTLGLLLGWLWPLWDANKQGWHDKMAKTVVVRQ